VGGSSETLIVTIAELPNWKTTGASTQSRGDAEEEEKGLATDHTDCTDSKKGMKSIAIRESAARIRIAELKSKSEPQRPQREHRGNA
jgi:endo-1,4-beta-D-glucanase Y